MKIKKRRFLDKYTTNTLFKKYLKSLFCILLIPFILFNIVTFFMNYHSVVASFENSASQILMRNIPALDNLLEYTYQGYQALIQNDCVNDFFSNDYFTGQRKASVFDTSIDISDLINNLTSSTKYVNSVHIYSRHNDYFFSSVSSNFRKQFYDSDCYALYQKHNFADFIDTHSIDGVPAITVCYTANTGSKNEGAVFFNLDSNVLSNLFLGEQSHNNGTILLAMNNQILLSTDNCRDYDISSCENAFESRVQFTKSSEYIYAYTALAHNSFKLIYLLKKPQYLSLFNNFMQNTALFLLFSLIAITMISFFGAIIQCQSISEAIASIEVSANDSLGLDEFAFMTDSILVNMGNSKNIESSLSEKINTLRKHQTLALQSQINPHFLFNSLNLISSYALSSCSDDSPLLDIVDKLSDILRFSLRTNSFIITIKDELENTKKYIEIENIKHDNSIEFIYDIDTKTLDYYCVKMILQPLIENAITHGVHSLKNEKGIIELSIKENGKKINFIIKNNGTPIPKEKVAELQSKLTKKNDLPISDHIGLNNVNQRIKLIFGNDFGCTFSSENGFTTVSVTIPKIVRKSNGQ